MDCAEQAGVQGLEASLEAEAVSNPISIPPSGAGITNLTPRNISKRKQALEVYFCLFIQDLSL